MSEFQKTDGKTPPPCPLCAGVTHLKEMWRHENGLHYFFKCIECSVEYPVVATPQ